jgi:hypothetical protein
MPQPNPNQQRGTDYSYYGVQWSNVSDYTKRTMGKPIGDQSGPSLEQYNAQGVMPPWVRRGYGPQEKRPTRKQQEKELLRLQEHNNPDWPQFVYKRQVAELAEKRKKQEALDAKNAESVVYAGNVVEGEEGKKKKKKNTGTGPTILTSSGGLLGSGGSTVAPTLLGN